MKIIKFLLFVSIVFFASSCKKKITGITYLTDEFYVVERIGARTGSASVLGASPYTFSISAIHSTDDTHTQDPNAIVVGLNNGVVALIEGNILPSNTYTIDISVSNVKGSTVFPAAVTFHIGTTPYSLKYENPQVELSEGESFVSAAPEVSGSSPIIFSLDSNEKEFVSIDENTGVITFDGTNTEAGRYPVFVTSRNNYGSNRLIGTTFTVVDKIVGKYNFTSATLIDGDINNGNTTNMLILNGDGTGVNVDVSSGESAKTGYYVNSILKGLAPCSNIDEETWTYQINLKSQYFNNELNFICTSENDINTNVGNWAMSNSSGSLLLNVNSSILGSITVEITNPVIDGTSISGKVTSFPMIIDADLPLSQSNVQYISFDIVLTQ